ncbi:MAG: TonB C-terminal domain-containing protein [Sulfurimonas sp.]|nr:TonB C-terminal domain-containing protein [Sulfurimonas sp.]
MDRNDRYFYISGFISLSLFIFFLTIFIYMLVSSDKINSFAMKKDNYISVSIVTPKIASSSVKKSVKKQVKEETSTPVKSKEINIDNLFSDVWTKSIKKTEKTEKKISNRRLMQIQKKITKSDENKVESISKKVRNMNAPKVDIESVKTSTATEVNEYLAKIQALVYEHFYPPQNSQGNSVEAIIELSPIGKVYDFRILRYSANSELNSECDNIKDRLMNIVFPKNPDNSSGTYTITLTSKE